MAETSALAQRKPMGAPRIALDFAKIEDLASRGCSEEEIAVELGVSVDTIQRRKKDHAKFAKALVDGRLKGRTRLRSAQFELAMSGNATMQIWLGKQPGPAGLGQIDTSYMNHGGSIAIEHDIVARLAAGRERLQAPELPVIDVVAAEEK